MQAEEEASSTMDRWSTFLDCMKVPMTREKFIVRLESSFEFMKKPVILKLDAS